MPINRRDFLILSAATAAGCAGGRDPSSAPQVALTPVSINAGPVDHFAKDGVYDQFVNQGFFIVRKGNDLLALSAFCTHRHFKLELQPDNTFYCKNHGSCFAQTGKVTEGPALVDLPKLPTKIDAHGHLLVLATA